ncbi:MAG: M23 family metallopeptidase [Flavobacteriaceae bacterium]|nr:M23 family metallopeptidase [Flavobacteriaceae bacterium]
MKKEKKSKKIRKKLLHKYRLVVLNEGTYEEKVSFKLSRLNVFVAGTVFAILLIGVTTLIIAFTPLREYIPGYASTKLKQQAIDLTDMADSLELALKKNDLYAESISNMLRGKVEVQDIPSDSVFKNQQRTLKDINLDPIEEDLQLRATVAMEDKYNLFEDKTNNITASLFAPLEGTLSDVYDIQKKHFAVDVVAPFGTPVKSVADGTVIFAEWTVETGYVILLEHQQGLLSVYKHNGTLMKEQGDLVKAGEVIASVGNTGEFTTGPHLHFELWSNGYPVNPMNYIDFE